MSGAQVIDGKAYAADLRGRVAAAVAGLKDGPGIMPKLAIVLVGDDDASHTYVRAKGRTAEDAGMATAEHLLPADTPEADVLALVARLNADAAVSGILVQLPLPAGIEQGTVLNTVDPMKDVDGFHPLNVGRLWSGDEGFVPCTPWGCLMMIEATLGDIRGKRALVIGRSAIVGKPMAALLLSRHATVTVAHSRTEDLAARCREADIVVAAAGRPRMVEGGWIKPGACVIDVGINRVPAPPEKGKEQGDGKTRIVGDVDFEAAREVAGFITPVPGGVGPMTIACLMRNTVIAAARQAGLPDPDL